MCLWMDDDLYDPYTHSIAFIFERLWARSSLDLDRFDRLDSLI